MIEEGISYPANGDEAFKRILIGGLLGLFSFLIVPLFILMGYFLRVLTSATRAETEPPLFEDWGDLAVDGLKATVVAIVYGIVPFALMFFSVGVAVLGSGSETGGAIFGSFGLLGFFISFLAMFAMYYLIPAALTNMAIEESMGAAFDFSRLKPVLFSSEYLIAWLVPFFVAFILNIVTMFFILVTLGFGILIVPFIQFYVQVAVFYLFGRAFGKVLTLDTVDQSDDQAAMA